MSQHPTSESEPQMIAAICFVLKHSLCDMAYSAAQQGGASSEDKLPHLSQQMSRAVASSLPPTLSLLQKLISHSLLLESQLAITVTIKYNASQFARALHMKLANIMYEFWSDEQITHMPSHSLAAIISLMVIFPWLQYFTDVVPNLEEAWKVTRSHRILLQSTLPSVEDCETYKIPSAANSSCIYGTCTRKRLAGVFWRGEIASFLGVVQKWTLLHLALQLVVLAAVFLQCTSVSNQEIMTHNLLEEIEAELASRL